MFLVLTTRAISQNLNTVKFSGKWLLTVIKLKLSGILAGCCKFCSCAVIYREFGFAWYDHFSVK